MNKPLWSLLAALALGGCGSSQDQTAQPVTVPAKPSGVTLKVLQMKDAERNIVFIRALLDANLPCDGVIKSERIPDQGGAPYWKAYCKNGGSHIITVTSDGTAKIISHA